MRRLVPFVGLLAACGSLPAVSIDDPGPDASGISNIGPRDGGDATDAGPNETSTSTPTWCEARAKPAAFCDDFDRGDLGARWDFFLMSPPGTAALDQTESRSAPGSLAILTRKLQAGDFGNILLRKSVDGAPSTARLGFDVFMDEVQATGTFGIATLDLSTDHLFTLYLRDDDPDPGPALVEVPPAGAPIVRHVLSGVPKAGTWTHVELAIDAAGGRATLLFDAAKMLDVAIAKAPTDKPTIRIGVMDLGPANPYEVRFDNVTLDVSSP